MTEKACFVLRIRPECLPEYTARHDDLWPEMKDALTGAGYRNYSIFADDTGLLVGYFESDDVRVSAARMAAHPVSERWSREIGWMFEQSLSSSGRVAEGHRYLTRVFDLGPERAPAGSR